MRIFEKRTKTDRIIFSIVFLLFFIYSFSLIYSFVWGFMSSLKASKEFYDGTFFPKKWLFSNYPEAFEKLKVGRTTLGAMVWNSVWFSVGSMIISLFFTTLTAYILSKYQFRGKKILEIVLMLVIFVPVYGAFASTYKFYHEAGMVNSYSILLSATGGFSFNTLLLISYFKNISSAYSEAAQIDGAGHFQIFYKIMLPQAMPLVSTLFLIGFIGKWNDYMTPILYLDKMPTLATGLFRFQETAVLKGLMPTLFAGLFIALIPILVLFVFMAKPMMNSVNIGGIKG